LAKEEKGNLLAAPSPSGGVLGVLGHGGGGNRPQVQGMIHSQPKKKKKGGRQEHGTSGLMKPGGGKSHADHSAVLRKGSEKER